MRHDTLLTDTFSRATTLPRSESHLRAYKAHAMNLSRWAILSQGVLRPWQDELFHTGEECIDRVAEAN